MGKPIQTCCHVVPPFGLFDLGLLSGPGMHPFNKILLKELDLIFFSFSFLYWIEAHSFSNLMLNFLAEICFV